MNGELASLIALALHANAWLAADEPGPAPDLLATNSAFQFDRTVTFTLASRTSKRTTDLGGIDGWLRYLRTSGVTRVSALDPDYWDADPAEDRPKPWIASAFANGAPWTLHCAGPGTSVSVWRAQSTVGDPSDPERRIWNVAFTGYEFPSLREVPVVPLETARAELVQALSDARTFARLQNETSWVTWFEKADAALLAPDPVLPYNPDLAPVGALTLAERQLMAAAMQGWVFGGMGSWNDLGIANDDDAAVYEIITGNLYAAVVRSLGSATNNPSANHPA